MVYVSYDICNDEPIIVAENVNILQKGTGFCKTFKDYFVNITDELDMYNWWEDVFCYSKLTSQMSVFNNQPSIRLIKDKYQKSFNFKFGLISTNHLRKYIDEIGCDKSSSGDIPANIIKMAE